MAARSFDDSALVHEPPPARRSSNLNGGLPQSPSARVIPGAETENGVPSLSRCVTRDRAFHRVLEECKLYTVELLTLPTSANAAATAKVAGGRRASTEPLMRPPNSAPTSSSLSGAMTGTVMPFDVAGAPTGQQWRVLIQEFTKTGARTASRDRHGTDRSGYSVRKMPDEVIATIGTLDCTIGSHGTRIRMLQLEHVENAFVMAAQDEATATGTQTRWFVERLAKGAAAFEAKGRFYYRVLVSIELRKGPDLAAPMISRHVFKNAEEIIECDQLYRCPDSSVTFVKLAYEDGWLFESLNSGIKVLEKLATEPAIEHGHFFYIVRIPVGIRVAPHIMAQRAGKGYKLHSIVEASQRFTPPGSKITYVRVCKEKGSRCPCTHNHHNQDNGTSEPDNVPTFSCHGGWIFEKTMDGQTVLERLERPAERQVERLFYRILEDVDVLPTPVLPSAAAANGESGQLPATRKRLKDTLIECSERLVPATTSDGVQFVFVKLRHDVGWICERDPNPPHRMMLEQVQGFAVTRDQSKFYRVLAPIYLRSAPDFECPQLPGVAPMATGCVFESSLQYTPPGSRITYIKVTTDTSSGNGNSATGWLFDQTPSGDKVLEAVDEDPDKKNGRFFYRVVCEKKEVLLSPERNSEVIKYLFANTMFAAEMEYTLPKTKEMYVRLTKEKGWIALDPPNCAEDRKTLESISEELYNLYSMPPSWVSVGFPNRTWFKVPDEQCRTILAEETLLQMKIFKPRNILAASSQGRDNVPTSRRGIVRLDGGREVWNCSLEEIKHSASALMFTFPWKQVWWIFELTGADGRSKTSATSMHEDDADGDRDVERHCVELQHGLRGGHRSIYFDGELISQNRNVTDILWDSGSEHSFTWRNHTFKAVIALEGAFFSQYLQFYSYSLFVDNQEIEPIDL